MNDPQLAPPALHLQISGELPWCVLGWRTYEQEDISPDLVAVYGPVESRDAAEALAVTLRQLVPGADTVMNFTAMPVFPVLPLSGGPGVART